MVCCPIGKSVADREDTFTDGWWLQRAACDERGRPNARVRRPRARAARRTRRAAVRGARERARAAHRASTRARSRACSGRSWRGASSIATTRRRATASACAWSRTRTPSSPASTCARSRARTSSASSRRRGRPRRCRSPGGTQPFTIDFVPSPSNVASRGELGRPSVTHATVTGKLLLAFGPLPLERLGPEPYERFTDRTLTTRAELAREVERVRAEGVAYGREEREPGLNAVGAAVLGREQTLARDAQHPGPGDPPARPPHAGPGLRAAGRPPTRSAPRSVDAPRPRPRPLRRGRRPRAARRPCRCAPT